MGKHPQQQPQPPTAVVHFLLKAISSSTLFYGIFKHGGGSLTLSLPLGSLLSSSSPPTHPPNKAAEDNMCKASVTVVIVATVFFTPLFPCTFWLLCVFIVNVFIIVCCCNVMWPSDCLSSSPSHSFKWFCILLLMLVLACFIILHLLHHPPPAPLLAPCFSCRLLLCNQQRICVRHHLPPPFLDILPCLPPLLNHGKVFLAHWLLHSLCVVPFLLPSLPSPLVCCACLCPDVPRIISPSNLSTTMIAYTLHWGGSQERNEHPWLAAFVLTRCTKRRYH